MMALPTVRAEEFDRWGETPTPDHDSSETDEASLVENDAEHRLLKAIVEDTLQPSSVYAARVRISSKTAGTIRRRLIERSLIREQNLGSGKRGRPAILLEALPMGVAECEAYERRRVE